MKNIQSFKVSDQVSGFIQIQIITKAPQKKEEEIPTLPKGNDPVEKDSYFKTYQEFLVNLA